MSNHVRALACAALVWPVLPLHAEDGGVGLPSMRSADYESPRKGSVSIGGGAYQFTDPTEVEALEQVFETDTFRDLQLGVAWMPIRLIRIDGGLDLMKREGEQVPATQEEDSTEEDTEDTTSADVEILSIAVANLGGTLRLDAFDEQFLVPFAKAGLSYALFKDDTSDLDVSGGKTGYYYAFGAELLLDRLEPARAADLDITQGINDIYLTLESRWQVMDPSDSEDSEGHNFSAHVIGLGLRFDY